MRRGLVCLALGATLVACNQPNQRLNAPPHGQPYVTADTQGTFTYMIDNAMLENMSVTDIHFHPHRDTLNPLGTERLARFASLMEVYGGTLRFNTDLADDELIACRMETIVEFLAEAGIDTTNEVVVRDMQGGEGMGAAEAILIRVNEGTYQPKDKSDSAEAPKAPTTP